MSIMLSLAALLGLTQPSNAASPAIVANPAPVFVAHPCPDARLREGARCGSVAVPEDRSTIGGRTINLNVVILSPTGPNPDLPPQYDLDGGPGLAVTPSVAFYLSEGAAYRARREIVLVDQRGTGASNPLSCSALDALEGSLDPMFPPAAVEQCRAEVSRHANPIFYGTRAAVEDLDAVRAALGHERIDLVALSYGTTLALRYIAAYPQRVRAAILMGAAPPAAMPPRDHAPAAERALGLLFAACAADEACRTAIPNPSADLDIALRRLGTTRPTLSPEVFMEKLRGLLYQPVTARRVPWIVHRAAAGDLDPFDAVTRAGAGPSRYALGVYLSITCGESFALMDRESAAAAARRTRFGGYRLRRQGEACRHWPAAQTAPDHLSPQVSPASGGPAVLIVSGELDPVTPPEWGASLARSFPRSRQLILPNSGHIFDGLTGIDTCLDPLMIRFLETADPASLDTECVARMAPPPFVVSEPSQQ